MSQPLDEIYLTWLYSQVGSVNAKKATQTYWCLFRQLYSKEFIWIVPNDDDRAVDGQDLRYEFMRDQGIHEIDKEWMDLGCSMLEMLIALSKRLSFETDRAPCDWFWELIENMGLGPYNDTKRFPHDDVDAILERVIYRIYNRDGQGGLFPLKRAFEDQRKVEIVYQLNAYLLERTYAI